LRQLTTDFNGPIRLRLGLVINVNYNASLEPTQVRERLTGRVNPGVILLKGISDELRHEDLIPLPWKIYGADVAHRVVGGGERYISIEGDYIENWLNVRPSFR
jgi:hypothetical protein